MELLKMRDNMSKGSVTAIIIGAMLFCAMTGIAASYMWGAGNEVEEIANEAVEEIAKDKFGIDKETVKKDLEAVENKNPAKKK